MCETMRIVSQDPEEQGPFIVINKDDFNPETQQEYVKHELESEDTSTKKPDK